MLVSSPYQIQPCICDKLTLLTNLINGEKEMFDQIASTTKDRHLRDSVRLLAQGTNQLGNELYCHLQTLGIDPKVKTCAIEPIMAEAIASSEQESHLVAGERLLQICCESEKKLVRSYREVLNEPDLPAETRSMLRRELNSVLYNFVQIKLLRTEYV